MQLQLGTRQSAAAVGVDGVKKPIRFNGRLVLLLRPLDHCPQGLGRLAEQGRETHRDDYRRGQ